MIDQCVHIAPLRTAELLLRYLDKIKYNGKKYFFSTIEDVFCGRISKIDKNYI